MDHLLGHLGSRLATDMNTADTTDRLSADIEMEAPINPRSVRANGDQCLIKDEEKVQVALIDTRQLTRTSVSHLLSTTTQEFDILSFSEPAELLADYPKHCGNVALVVFNIGASAISDNVIRKHIDGLKQALPLVPIVILCDLEDLHFMVSAFQQGIRGYIPTTCNPSVLIGALKLVQAGGTFMPANTLINALEGQTYSTHRSSGAESPNLEGFTPRQQEVLQLLRQGKSNKVIAYELDVEESTVKVHVRQIMRKLRVTNRTHAALLAQKMCGA